MRLGDEEIAEIINADEEFRTLSVGVEDFYPAELTSRYTNGIAMTKIRTPGQA
jgi:hypothetical protein